MRWWIGGGKLQKSVWCRKSSEAKKNTSILNVWEETDLVSVWKSAKRNGFPTFALGVESIHVSLADRPGISVARLQPKLSLWLKQAPDGHGVRLWNNRVDRIQDPVKGLSLTRRILASGGLRRLHPIPSFRHLSLLFLCAQVLGNFNTSYLFISSLRFLLAPLSRWGFLPESDGKSRRCLKSPLSPGSQGLLNRIITKVTPFIRFSVASGRAIYILQVNFFHILISDGTVDRNDPSPPCWSGIEFIWKLLWKRCKSMEPWLKLSSNCKIIWRRNTDFPRHESKDLGGKSHVSTRISGFQVWLPDDQSGRTDTTQYILVKIKINLFSFLQIWAFPLKPN